MSAITLDLPDDLVERLRAAADRLPRILELGLRELDASSHPETGALTPLYHPRRERWWQHSRIDEGKLMPLTPAARVTVRLLQLNHPDRVVERALLISAGLIRPPVAPAG
jgi:hypothetical protein